ncbi:hypothetical protein ACE1CD_01010 [Aerosakkonema sp. BLCC-F183]|uniref:hypothetical protein n=1 Tax=Aerosakkonema sp. BLCC-F183 TaxID=3342834 RepID=UPI0035B9CD4C
MPYELVNLTLPIVIQEIENVLEGYPEYPYQAAFSMPELRQTLIAHVLSQIPNYYEVKGVPKASNNSKVRHFSLQQEKLRVEMVICDSISYILRENASWQSRNLSNIQGQLAQEF